eukprot:Anaeramoba_ignava/c20727_g2_i4.p1 GENE.c20727_g2_i4~~c20727_g2_i4.p1  ORF type:complete len:305 (-),score=96.39 c20727_g2_i4:517-1431(-)
MSFTWKEIESRSKIKPEERFRASYTLYNNKIIIYGGCKIENYRKYIYYDDMYEFDLATKKWSKIEQIGDLPAARWGNTTVVHDDRLIIFGGRQKSKEDPTPFYFDLKKRVWSNLDTKGDSESLYYHASVVYKNRYMISIGGLIPNDKYNTKIYSLDLEKLEWKVINIKGENLSPRFGHTAVIENDDIYVLGGYKRYTLSGLFKFNLLSNSWSRIVVPNDDIWTMKESHSAVLDPKSKKMIIFGGLKRVDGIETNFNNITTFNLITQQWEEVPTKGQPPRTRGVNFLQEEKEYFLVFKFLILNSI